jgi:hypothetical protein
MRLCPTVSALCHFEAPKSGDFLMRKKGIPEGISPLEKGICAKKPLSGSFLPLQIERLWIAQALWHKPLGPLVGLNALYKKAGANCALMAVAFLSSY